MQYVKVIFLIMVSICIEKTNDIQESRFQKFFFDLSRGSGGSAKTIQQDYTFAIGCCGYAHFIKNQVKRIVGNGGRFN
jgi:hypothetical protein